MKIYIHGLAWSSYYLEQSQNLWTVHASSCDGTFAASRGRVECGALVLMLEIHFESLHVTVVYSDVIAFF